MDMFVSEIIIFFQGLFLVIISHDSSHQNMRSGTMFRAF